MRDNAEKIKEEDIILLLEIINSYNTTVYMLPVDSIFHEAPKVQELLATINVKRNNGIEKLCIRLVDGFKFSDICYRVYSQYYVLYV